jgi:hypothetical protein
MEITKYKNPWIFYRFLNPYPSLWIFLLENHIDLGKKSRDFWLANFFLEIFKIHRLVWIFLWIFDCFESVSSMFCFK